MMGAGTSPARPDVAVRFDGAARKAIDLAMIEVERLGHSSLGSLHLLLGVLRVADGKVAHALDQLGVDADSMAGLIVRALAAGSRDEDDSAAESALEGASALAGDAAPVTAFHILLSVADGGETEARRVLEQIGVSAAQLRTVGTPSAPSMLRDAGLVEADRTAGVELRPVAHVRTGIGYDSHRFEAGGPLVLGGVAIPSDLRLVGHSDGDAVAHATTDAVLGAAAAGDIGELFPDSDPANRGRNSIEMLRLAVHHVQARGWQVDAVDIVVVAERPRISAYREAMRRALSQALGVAPSAVSVKGKTNEGMGWIGRGEGIACMAVATLSSRR
jgi:2-C-methyl-D-erythritol 2,4-cyclodiphosphate synthase